MEIVPARNVKEVQSLNGKIAVLNRFVSRATDKCLPFFHTLKKSFEWTTEFQQSFEELKAYLSSPQLLSPSQPGEELFLYLVVSPAAVSTTLVREEERVQKLVYYASRALRSAKERYPRPRNSYDSPQTQTVLSSLHGDCPDRQAFAAGDEQP